METFKLSSDAICGFGASGLLPSQLEMYGYRKVAILIDNNLSTLRPFQILLERLVTSGLEISSIVKHQLKFEPTYDELDGLVGEFVGGDFEVLIAIGGGAILDLAKGISILLKNSGQAIEYRGFNKVKYPGVPLVLVPTTAGSGSEVTKTASLIDTKSQTKLGINGRYVECLFSVLDSELIMTCPNSVLISSALDAMVHAVEAVTSRSANTLSVLLGSEALRFVFSGLSVIDEEKNKIGAYTNLSMGSHLAGLAMSNAGGGPASGISYPLGVHYMVPHGFAGGVLLPYVMEFNIGQGYYEGYSKIFDSISPDRIDVGLNGERKANLFLQTTQDIYEKIQAPKDFANFGVGKVDIANVVRLTIEQRKANLELNPVSFGENDVKELLEKVMN